MTTEEILQRKCKSTIHNKSTFRKVPKTFKLRIK